MDRGGRKLKRFSVESGFTSQIFTGEFSGVDLPGALRDCFDIIIYKIKKPTFLACFPQHMLPLWNVQKRTIFFKTV